MTLKYWLEFASSLAWPLVVLFLILFFRRGISATLDELASFVSRIVILKFGALHVEGQSEVDDPPEPEEGIKEDTHTRVAGGFYSREGIRQLVGKRRELKDYSNKVIDTLLVFKTDKQRTWLVSTPVNILFLLDDERTQASGRIIQKIVKYSNIGQIVVNESANGATTFSIDDARPWYYSKSLMGTREEARKTLQEFIIVSKQKNNVHET